MNKLTPAQKKDNLESYKRIMEAQKAHLERALPKHVSIERFMRLCLNALANTPKLFECSKESFFLSVMRAASLGLEPDGLSGEAYLIPYGNVCQLVIGYKGLMKLAWNSGEISRLSVESVCANDEINLDFFGDCYFKPKLNGSRGAVIGFIAVAKFKQDGALAFEYMNLEQVEKIRDNSQAWKQALKDAKRNENGEIVKFVNKWNKEIDSVPWFHHFEEMGKKTIMRRFAKRLPSSVQKAVHMEELQEKGVKFDFDGKDFDIKHVPYENEEALEDDFIPDGSAERPAVAITHAPAEVLDFTQAIAEINNAHDDALLNKIKAGLPDDAPQEILIALENRLDFLYQQEKKAKAKAAKIPKPAAAALETQEGALFSQGDYEDMNRE